MEIGLEDGETIDNLIYAPKDDVKKLIQALQKCVDWLESK
jgi:hypothetical protein